MYASSGLFACSSHLLNGIIPSNGVMWSSISMGHAQTLGLGMVALFRTNIISHFQNIATQATLTAISG